MKKFYLLAGTLIGGMALNAQIQTSVSAKNERNEIRPVAKKATNSDVLKAEGDILWDNQFDVSGEWAATTGPTHAGSANWEIITAIPTGITGQQAAYQWPATFSNATGNFAFINSDGAGGTGIQDAYFEFQGDIDLSASGNASVYLTFAEYYRHYYDKNYVEVSNDGGLNWSIFEVNPVAEVPVNTNCADGEEETVNITPTIGAGVWSNQVRIRFHYVGAWDWFWGIDDVRIVEAWDNDMKMTTWFQATDIATTQGLDYYNISASQTSFPGLTFGANVLNNGALNQASVALNATATGGYNQTGAAISINSTLADTLSIATPYIPSGIGTKTVNITTTIPATDSDLTNNVGTFDLFMTQYEYSRDNNISSGSIGQVSSQDAQPLKIGNVMEIFDDMEVTSVKIRLATQPAGAVGAEYFAEIYKYDDVAADFVYFAETVLSTVANTTATWSNLMISGGSITLNAGDVILVVAAHLGGTDEVRFGLAQNTTEGTVLGYTADGNSFQLTSPSAVMIRLNEDPSASISEVATNYGVSVYPNPTSSNATISLDLNKEAAVAITVTELSGKVVYATDLGTVNGTQNVTVHTDALSSGVYMVNITVDGAVSTQKLVVRK